MISFIRSGILITLFLSIGLNAWAQFHPPAGQPGSNAIHADSSVFIDWASTATVYPSWIDIADTTLGLVTHGIDSAALGKADNDVVSLGDGGTAVLTFDYPIVDGPGPDFAVFENAFADAYLELGFVEVSSDGINFFRFPAVSNTDTSVQVGGFDTLDATKIDQLAGKYRTMYGVPFDLANMVFQTGLDINNVTHVRIVDVVGSIDPAYATYDIKGWPINEPYPTPWASSGFDLDAIGVINNTQNVGIADMHRVIELRTWPNPASNVLYFSSDQNVHDVIVFDIGGRTQLTSNISAMQLDISSLAPGHYFGKAYLSDGHTAGFSFVKH